MFAIYLFTVVFVSLCLLIADDTEPRNFTFACEGTYEVQTTLDTFPWIADFVAEASPKPEVNTITEASNPTIVTDKETSVEPETSETDLFEARVKAITEAMTKAEILRDIKRHGWYEPCLSRMSKRELAQVKATREN